MLSNGTTLYKASVMDDKNKHILSLIEKFEQGRASEEDMQELDVWFRSQEANTDLTDSLTPEQQELAKSNLLKRISNRIDSELPKEAILPRRKIISSVWVKMSAACLLLICIGAYFFLNNEQPAQPETADLVTDFAPGSNKAVLTLGNGKQIVLDEAQTGKLADEGNTIIKKTDEGKIVYGQNGKNQSVVSNTLATPKGGTYHLILADGTAVWLNASSSITYPSAFTGNTREVSISGEAYLEVAHNPGKPFRVKTGTQTVEVLGTHFNINAYDGQHAIKTTLLEGSVALTSAGQRKLLKPGQQGSLAGNTIRITKVDVAEVMAWKDGFFDFTDADIQTVMEEFSRWYNLDIVFDGQQTKETFTGRIPRSWSFAKVMNIMGTFKSTHITTKGRRVMVKQK